MFKTFFLAIENRDSTLNCSVFGSFYPFICLRIMLYTETDVLKALSKVEDPDLHRDLVSLNMIKDLAVKPGRVSFTVVLTTPACPLKEKIRRDCEDAVRAVIGPDATLDITMSSSVT